MDWVDKLIDGHDGALTAIIDDSGKRTDYRTLRRETEDCDAALVAAGVRPGDRVMLVAENSPLIAPVLLACARLRAWCVPVNARLTAAELDALRAHSTPRVTIFTNVVSPDAAAHAKRLGAKSGPPVMRRQLTYLTDLKARPEPVGKTPQTQPMLLIYTSGTTGAPKGVMLSHASVSWNARIAAEMRAMTPEDELLLTIPGTHIMALATGYLAALRAGAAVRLMTRFSVDGALNGLAQGATIFSVVPQVYRLLLDRIDAGTPLVAPRLRQIGCGGAPLDPGLKARIETVFGLPLHNGYGMTEAGPGIASTTMGPKREDGSVGYAFPGCELRVDSPGEDGVGELQVRGPNVMLGYFRDPDATAQAMTEDGFLRTGDLVRLDPDGALHLAGRSKELIIRSGFNVYPAEIETLLLTCPGVRQAAVAGRQAQDNEEVLAFVTTDGSTDAATIKSFLDDRLAAYKRPQIVTVVAEMPLNANGKIMKAQLVAGLAS
ncbi:acyl--CoA ligase [Rhodobacter sp. NTK016B]|uniref:class I adenylate-forming enzyme family protein n=1 Tax=Rhodobacter sp. NTK016B TaxID=2759676 RepID=UPI001A8BF439|nr:class I adenylate-forming enzyme family protein [Rhodobacter sp. NTK016B]MBN8290836.1 acyl--CoA ligase [Rhodobacter sp. NTK016B]